MKDLENENENDKELAQLNPAVRIFLVEDNPDHVFIALTVVKQVLGEEIELVHAQNADEALLMISQFTDNDRPDLFLVDLRLPDNGGFFLFQAARGDAALSSPPMVVISVSLSVYPDPHWIAGSGTESVSGLRSCCETLHI